MTTLRTPTLALTPEPVKRTIGAIATEIAADWGGKVNYAAKPYLAAMRYLRDSDSKYGAEDSESVVVYFLSNASTYRTAKAKGLKAELKAHFPRMK
jgi:hypothetical protein